MSYFLQKSGYFFPRTKIVPVFLILLQSVFAQDAVRIMPIGDSITWGTNPDDSTGNNGYRRHLYFQLKSEDYNFDFVGTLEAGIPEDFDRDNEGHPGMYAYRKIAPQYSLRDNILNYLYLNNPDIALLHIGTNDLTKGIEPKSTDSLAGDVAELLNLIHYYNSDVITVVARIIKRSDRQEYIDSTRLFNMKLQEKADYLIAQGNKIIVVDMESALVPTDMSSDMLHPNEKGFSKMADIWFNEVQKLLIIKPSYPENFSDVFNKNITLKWNSAPYTEEYRLQVARDSNFSDIVFNITVADTFTLISSLEANTRYFWRVQRKVHNNYSPYSEVWSFSAFSLVSADDEINNPVEFSLLQNYPDPFNSSTTIEFEVPEKTTIILSVYDILGNKISDLFNEEKNPGRYSIQFNAGNIDGRNLASGIYIYNLRTNSFNKSRKMILLK